MQCPVYLSLIVFAACSAPVLAGNAVETPADVETISTPAQMSPVSHCSTRLRFRSGPVCMCSGGLTEAQIGAAESLRRKAKNKTKSASDD